MEVNGHKPVANHGHETCYQNHTPHCWYLSCTYKLSAKKTASFLCNALKSKIRLEILPCAALAKKKYCLQSLEDR